MATTLPGFPPFDVDTDKTTTGTRWTKWVLKLEVFMAAYGITNPDRQKAILLHFAGDTVFEIASTLDLTPRPADQAAQRAAEDAYAATKRVLNAYFSPSNNKEYNIYVFRQAKQGTDEPIDQYFARLKKLAVGCEFQDQDGELKSQVIQGCQSTKLRLAALQDSTLTLARLIEKERTVEMTKIQAQSIEQKTTSPEDVEETNKIDLRRHLQKRRQQSKDRSQSPEKKSRYDRSRPHQDQRGRRYQFESRDRPHQYQERRDHRSQDKYDDESRRRGSGASSSGPYQRRKPCPFCGGQYHQDGIVSCPARGKKCNHCGNLNHFASQCIKKQFQQQRGRSQRSSTNAVSDEHREGEQTDQSSSDGEQAYTTVTYNNMGRAKAGQPRAEIIVTDVPISFLVDTGSTVTLIDSATHKKIGNPRLKPTKMKIFAFKAGLPIPLKGECTLNISTQKGRYARERIFVTADCNKGCILSYGAATRLKLIKMAEEVTVAAVEAENQKLKPIGKMKGIKVKLHINPNIAPVAMPHRRIPYHLRAKVEAEIEKLEKLDIIEKVSGPTPWVSPVVIVPKPNGSIRLCVDMRQPNKAIERERHVIPTIEDILAEVSESKIFSVIDLNQAFHQMELEEESRFITTFSTHVGLRRYKRLFFGLNAASEIFHNTLREMLSDIEGAINSSDDILIHGRNREEHDVRLHRVKKRLAEMNVTINADKQQLGKEAVKFHGVILTSKGLKVDPEKVKIINNFKRPKNVTEVRSFLGMVNYCSRFIKNHANLTEPLRKLIIKDGAEFRWSKETEKAFVTLKKELSDTHNLAFFNNKLKSEVIVDASPVGLGAILCQLEASGKPVVVAYASKALTPTEQRYSQTEREALAIIWGCEQFQVYLIGTKFVVWTDHKALVPIFNNPAAKLSVRMERWMLRKQVFDMEVQYLPGEWNAADYLSRNPGGGDGKLMKLAKVAERYVNFITTNAAEVMSAEEIRKETDADETLSAVKKAIKDGRWYKLSKELKRTFEPIKQELTVSSGGIILRGDRIVMPNTLQAKVIEIAHEGHQGIEKTKRHLRSRIWFPKMDKMTEAAVKKCMACQVSTESKRREPIKPSLLPNGPWEDLSVDFYTRPNGEEIMVTIDDFSRFPVAEIVRSTAFSQVWPKLNHLLAMLGIPKTIKTDNGPPFNGREFKAMADHLGFKHRKITPVWPEANGEVERFMRTLGKLMRTAVAEKKNWKEELEVFPRSYRNTKHAGTGFTPAELLFGRKLRDRLPDLFHTDEAYKSRMKEQADKKRRAKEHGLQVGDWVLRRKEKKMLKKTEPYYEMEPYRVVAVKESMVTVENRNGIVTRNCSCFKKLEGGVRMEGGVMPPPDEPTTPQGQPNQQQRRRERGAGRAEEQGGRQVQRRGGRERNPPRWAEDFETPTIRRRL